MTILSIQSLVAAGYVGNSVAVPALQALGRDVWMVPTVLFAHHPGHGGLRGRRLPADEVAPLLNGLAGLSVLGGLGSRRGVLLGYLGTAPLVAPIAATIDALRDARPDGAPEALVACDPVLGDLDTGLYVDPALPAAMAASLVPRADLLLPNLFELALLTGGEPVDAADPDAVAARARRLLAPAGAERGPRAVVVTGLADRDRGRMGNLVVRGCRDSDGPVRLVTARRVSGVAHVKGTGDLLAALTVGLLLDHPDPRRLDGAAGAALETAVALAAEGVALVLEETARRGGPELALIPALPALAALRQREVP